MTQHQTCRSRYQWLSMTSVTELSVLYYKSPPYKKTAPYHRCGLTLSINRLLLKPTHWNISPTSPRTNPSKTALSIENRHHPCLPCQREVDWRQGTNLNIIAFTCDMSTLFILQTFLPSRRRDCNTYCALSVSLTPPLTIPQSQWRKTWFFINISFILI